MIKRKEKLCKGCNKQQFLFSKGLCKQCWQISHKATLKPVSDHQKVRLEKYMVLRNEWLKEHPKCEVCNLRDSIEVHHLSSRLGNNLFKDFCAICRECHTNIHDNTENGHL